MIEIVWGNSYSYRPEGKTLFDLAKAGSLAGRTAISIELFSLSLVFTNGANAIYDCHALLDQMTAFDQVSEVYHSRCFG
jgi:hypothetical protein